MLLYHRKCINRWLVAGLVAGLLAAVWPIVCFSSVTIALATSRLMVLRAQPAIDAILAYEAEAGVPPASLDEALRARSQRVRVPRGFTYEPLPEVCWRQAYYRATDAVGRLVVRYDGHGRVIETLVQCDPPRDRVRLGSTMVRRGGLDGLSESEVISSLGPPDGVLPAPGSRWCAWMPQPGSLFRCLEYRPARDFGHDIAGTRVGEWDTYAMMR